MSGSRWERLAPLTGVAFFVLIAFTLALSNDTPDMEGRLSLVAFAGILTIAIGGAVASALQLTAADTVNDVPRTVTQTLAVLSEDFFFPFLAGIAVFMFAAGVCAIRHGGLPKWLAWAAIVIGVVSVTPVGFIGFVLVFVWVLVASVVLYPAGRREPRAQGPGRVALRRMAGARRGAVRPSLESGA
ncbi:MAG TPA: hypothetical protein VH391_02485 [Solirubrobacterales bacterium]|jgi:hypothetical protein